MINIYVINFDIASVSTLWAGPSPFAISWLPLNYRPAIALCFTAIQTAIPAGNFRATETLDRVWSLLGQCLRKGSSLQQTGTSTMLRFYMLHCSKKYWIRQTITCQDYPLQTRVIFIQWWCWASVVHGVQVLTKHCVIGNIPCLLHRAIPENTKC